MSQKTEKNNKKSRKRILLCFLLFFGVFASYFSPQSASSSGGSMTVEKKKSHAKNKQKQTLINKNGIPFAVIELSEDYYIQKDSSPFRDLEYVEAYTVYKTKTEEKVASIDTGLNLFEIYREYYKNKDYQFMEDANSHGIRYLIQRNVKNKNKYQEMFYITDNSGNTILIYDFDKYQKEGTDIINAIKPMKNNFYSIPDKNNIPETIQKNNSKQEIIYISFGLFFVWILNAVGKCRIFKKLGRERWKAFIPVYSDSILFKYIWNTKGFILYYSSFVFLLIFNYYNNTMLLDNTDKNILEFLLMICFFWFLFVFYKYIGYLCDAFGKKRRFFILALFCIPMAYFMLGKKKVRYIGNMSLKKSKKENG